MKLVIDRGVAGTGPEECGLAPRTGSAPPTVMSIAIVQDRRASRSIWIGFVVFVVGQLFIGGEEHEAEASFAFGQRR